MAMQFNGLTAEVQITNTYDGVANLTADRTQSSATSGTDTYTVPTDKFWILKGISVQRANAGGVRFRLNIDSTDYDLTSFGSVTDGSEVNLALKLKADDSVKCVFSAGTSGTLISTILYEEYDL